MVSSVTLRRNQIQLIPWFKTYHIDDNEPILPEPKQLSCFSHLMSRFTPESNDIDKKILFEITGRKKPTNIFQDESSTSSSED